MVVLRTEAEIATIRQAGRVVAETLAAVALRAGVPALVADASFDADLLSIDLAVIVDGYHADAAITVGVGALDPAAVRLSATTSRALEAGVAAAVPGGRIGDIAHAIETVGRGAGYGIPDGLGGHGVGTAMHEEPRIPNTGRPGRGLELREGLVIAIEPMLIEGGGDRCRVGRDGWTILTADGSRAAHWEHTIPVTADGPVVLTSAT